MQTVIQINDPLAVKRWSGDLAVSIKSKSYWTKFIGTGDNVVIQQKTDLEQTSGDSIKFDLNVALRGGMVMGDAKVDGTGTSLTFYQDQVIIDQARKQTESGGRMTAKRTLHNLRALAKDRTADYVAEWLDDLAFIHQSGDDQFASLNVDTRIRNAAEAINPVLAPDAAHQVYGGVALGKAELTAADKLDVKSIQRLATKARTMAVNDIDVLRMEPVSVEGGGKHFVLLIHPFQSYDLKTGTGENSWAAYNKAMATAVGRDADIFKGSMGMIDGVVIHEHEKVRLFGGYGAGGTIKAARSLMLGQQAGVVAYGSAGGKNRIQWHEEAYDAGAQMRITAGLIMGWKKSRFAGKDYGTIAADFAYADPT